MQPMLVLGIESSCDETGMALYSTDAGGTLLAHARRRAELRRQVEHEARAGRQLGGVREAPAEEDAGRDLVPRGDRVAHGCSGHRTSVRLPLNSRSFTFTTSCPPWQSWQAIASGSATIIGWKACFSAMPSWQDEQETAFSFSP